MLRLLASFLTLSLFSCGGAPQEFTEHGYRWIPNPLQQDCDRIQWVQYGTLDILYFCGPNSIGCGDGRGCTVSSMYGPADADLVFLPGTDQSHLTHETYMHIERKLSHPK